MINKLKYLWCAMCSTGTLASEDHVSFKFGGWSKHLTDLHPNTKKTIGDFNENHNAIGVEYNIGYGDNYFYSVGVHLMDDSYDERAFSIGLSWKKRFDKLYNTDWFVDVGLTGGIQQRSFINYQKGTYEYISTETITIPFVAPLVNIGYQNFYTNIMVYPHITEEDNRYVFHKPVIFWQFGIDFKV